MLSRLPYRTIAKIGTGEWTQSIIPLSLTAAGLATTGAFIYGLHKEEVPCALVTAVMANRTSDVRWYLEHGACPNISDLKQRSLLYFATEQNHIEIARLLLEHGADPNKKEYRGAAPIHRAIEFGHLEIADLLKKYKADINAYRDDWKYTPIHIATEDAERIPALQWLLDNHADINKTVKNGNTTALYNALKGNNMPAFKLLLQRGALKDRSANQDILHHACGLIRGRTAVALLLAYGADVNARDEAGYTPLMVSPFPVDLQDPEVVQLLLSFNADKTIQASDGSTIFDYVRIPQVQALWRSNQLHSIPQFARNIIVEKESNGKNIVKKLQKRELTGK